MSSGAPGERGLRAWPLLVPALVATIGVAVLLPEAVAKALALEPLAVTVGQPWRWPTCHLVHFGAWHAARDGSLLLGVAIVAGRRRARVLGISILAALALVPAAVLLLEPALTPYRGASGLGAAAVAGVGLSLALDRSVGTGRRAAGGLAVAVLMALTLFEAAAGRTIRVPGPPGATVAVAWSAHLAGLLAGLGGWAWDRHLRRRVRL